MCHPPRPSRCAFILASASPRRRVILSLLGVPFEVISPEGVDEGFDGENARDIAQRLACRKAEAVARMLRLGARGAGRDECPILAADTVVALEGGAEQIVLGKPAGAADARRMLRLIAGRTHDVWTGVAVVGGMQPLRVEAERSKVAFRELSEEVIERYVASGEPYGKAGAYAIQGRGESLVESFAGCYYNVVGLPLLRAARLLGISPDAALCDCARHALQRGAEGCARRFA